MDVNNPRGFVALATDQIDADGRQWIEVMPTADKARNGRWYFTITRGDLDTYAEFIQANPDRIPVDYDHEGADGGSTAAAGWFTGQAEVRDTDEGPRLFAQIEWTQGGLDDVKSKRFRFISPEWSMHDRDQKTGLLTKAKALIAATLTNRPFFTELAPVASVVWTANEGLESLRQRVSQAINPGGGMDMARYWVMDIAASSALIQEYAAQKTWVAAFQRNADGSVAVEPADAWVEAQQEWVAAAAQALQHNLSRKPFHERNDMDTTVLAKSLGLAEDADETAIADAIKAKDDKITDLEAKAAETAASQTEVEQLRGEIDSLKAARDTDRKTVLFDQAVRDRQLVPAQRDTVLGSDTAAGWSVEQLAEYVKVTPKATFKETGDGGDADEGDDGDDAKEIQAAKDRFSRDDEPVEGADVHVKAMNHLKDQGKTKPTQEEYAEALELVSA